ncbi:unnamed protein product [Trichogramma brassicae]|uniref:Uncharacterized protein n=1 Tax=Trichogramma brassicae TaxID=86971 RepID=A0A6H5INN1_9HYME|nr:unnamed protein product [Trichogramma brassicae]
MGMRGAASSVAALQGVCEKSDRNGEKLASFVNPVDWYAMEDERRMEAEAGCPTCLACSSGSSSYVQ